MGGERGEVTSIGVCGGGGEENRIRDDHHLDLLQLGVGLDDGVWDDSIVIEGGMCGGDGVSGGGSSECFCLILAQEGVIILLMLELWQIFVLCMLVWGV